MAIIRKLPSTLPPKNQTNSLLKEGVGGYFAIFLQVRSESQQKKGTFLYHYKLHPPCFIFSESFFPACHEGRVPSSESPLPSQSKLVFRKIDNSKASSSWMANLFSKNPGTEVPKTRIHGTNGIYMLGGGNLNIFRIFTPKIREMIPNLTSISFNWFRSATN